MKGRIAVVRQERDATQAVFDRLVAKRTAEAHITEAKIAGFIAIMRDNILSGGTAFHRIRLCAIIDQVEVGDMKMRMVKALDLGVPRYERRRGSGGGARFYTEVAEGMGLTSNLLQYKSLILFDAHSCYAGRAGVRPQRLALS